MSVQFAAANREEVECVQVWRAFQSMSGFDASLPMQQAMVSRQARTVYETMVVCLLFP